MLPTAHRGAVIGATALALTCCSLVVAAPADATAPKGPAKPVVDGPYPSSLCDATDVTFTRTHTDIQQTRTSGTATPGTETLRWSDSNGWVEIRDANMTITSEVDNGTTTTITIVSKGLLGLVHTSEQATVRDLTAAGQLNETVVISDATGDVISDTTTLRRGRQISGDSGDVFCAAADAALL